MLLSFSYCAVFDGAVFGRAHSFDAFEDADEGLRTVVARHFGYDFYGVGECFEELAGVFDSQSVDIVVERRSECVVEVVARVGAVCVCGFGDVRQFEVGVKEYFFVFEEVVDSRA